MSVYLVGRSEEVLKSYEDGTFDTVITDAPYGLSFMGKRWDYDVPSIELWEEVYRVAKPGATLLCFAGSRTQHRMACNIEDAGWILKDCIMWIYGSGFPKATDISKQMDKKAGAKRDDLGEHPNPNSTGWITAGKAKDGKARITAPATPEAQLWDGWKSHGLKPAYEPILVAMKPNEGSYAENALRHGVAGLNIDGGRIGTEDKFGGGGGGFLSGKGFGTIGTGEKTASDVPQPEGRYPANVILDEEAGRMLDEQSGYSSGDRPSDISKSNTSLFNSPNPREGIRFKDSGGASRFFYCAKASKAERNNGCEELGLKPKGGTYNFRVDGSLDGKPTAPKQNNHPTVKPLKLMEYLCKLTKTPTGGIVLDPFAGSGTTGLACINTGRDYILIDIDPEYREIFMARSTLPLARAE